MVRVLTAKPVRRVWVGSVLGVLVGLAALFVPVAAQAFAIRGFAPALYDGDALGSIPAETPGSVVPQGPDGNMWFTTSAGRIARVTPSGAVTEFGHGITDGGAGSLVAGSDGALWFSEAGTGQGGDVLGRITTSGAVTEYQTGLPQVSSLARGGDGALWYDGCAGVYSYVCPQSQRVGRMDTSGRVQTFPVTAGVISQLVEGGDGKLWSSVDPGANSTSGEIIRISLDGTMKTFSLPEGVWVPYYVPLVPGPGGGVWFTSNSGTSSSLGYITDSGQITMLAPVLPATGEVPYLIAPGPRGAVLSDTLGGDGGGGQRQPAW